MDPQQRKILITPKPAFPTNADYRIVEESLNRYFKSEELSGYVVGNFIPMSNCWIVILNFDQKIWLRNRAINNQIPKFVEVDEDILYGNNFL